MVFKKGQVFFVKYSRWRNLGGQRGYVEIKREGRYQVVRTGSKMYLHGLDDGIDWNPTKRKLEESIIK